MLRCVAFENILKAYKSSMYQTIRLEEIAAIKQKIINSINRSEKKKLIKALRDAENKYDKILFRVDKYNSEFTKSIEKSSKGQFNVDEFIDNAHTLISDFMDLIFENKITTESIKNYYPSLLEKSEKGNLFISGSRFIIHHKQK